MKKPAVLIIMDGYGIAPKSEGNAVTTADKPNLDKIFSFFFLEIPLTNNSHFIPV